MSKDVKRMFLEEPESFTSGQVSSAIKNCRSSRAYDPDSFSIFHLKNLGPLASEHLTTLYNDSLKSYLLPSIWKTSLVILIPKHGKDSSQGTSYRPISLLCPAAKVLEALLLPSMNELLSPAKDQHGFRPRHSTTYALLQLTTDIEFVLCVVCLTAFVNCLVKQFAICLGVFVILLFNVMELLSVVRSALLDRPCMVFQSMCVLCLWF